MESCVIIYSSHSQIVYVTLNTLNGVPIEGSLFHLYMYQNIGSKQVTTES